MLKKSAFIGANLFLLFSANAQPNDPGQIHGNVNFTFQQYGEDTLINAAVPPSETAINAYTNLIYSRGKFSAGVRFESYLNALQGYPPNFVGNGIGYRYASYKDDFAEVTIGNIYEQFGSGLTLRAWEDRTLGIDNTIDGARLKLKPFNGLVITGVYGKVRVGFNNGLVNSQGFVKGINGELSINEAFGVINAKAENNTETYGKSNKLAKKISEMPLKIGIGGSFVSKYQKDEDPDLILPENVGTWSYRLNLQRKGIFWRNEYVYKINDPSTDNNFVYKPGEAFLSTLGYSTKGFGLVLEYKYTDNMSYRIDRGQQLTIGTINFLPALTRPHTYNLAATLYPYNVQFNEVAYQANLSYKIKRGTKIGGKYGTTIELNYALATSIDSTATISNSNPLYGYNAKLFGQRTDEVFFQDINVTITRKLNKNNKLKLTYINFIYNNDINQSARDNFGNEVHGNIYAHIGVIDWEHKLNTKNAIRTELQNLTTEEHLGDWATAVIEFTRSPHWFFAVMDQYNYGNEDPDRRIHYLLGSVGYIKDAHRLTLSYGRQREGLFCVGGVCRTVPASNGVTVTYSTTF